MRVLRSCRWSSPADGHDPSGSVHTVGPVSGTLADTGGKRDSEPSRSFHQGSTGSQDESSQIKVIDDYAEANGITIVKTFRLKGYSASKGTQEPALREAIADIERGDYSALIVTESSRLDRREDLDAQADILLSVRAAGGDIISIAEPQFGKSDFTGRIVTLVAQHANAEKSRTVKQQTYRGLCMIRDNNAHQGFVKVLWAV
jgi:Resolvase, N terminal domain